ncbi:type I polyketide synthase [Streptomyces rochei]|uniref:type I polyketide synthase n=1 Tax=Streptomyces rochei TaxID=1928 RepID=UPI0022E9DAA4|nr:type I polyketide synthase [Streptomyces rochei]MCC8454479.1 SDR family oxidoreductase [Streptomyces rochei]
MSETHPPQVPVAVVGVGALAPGSTDPTEFWRTVLSGRDMITDVPPSRWLVEDHYDPDPAAPDKTYASRGAFLPEVGFDPLAYGIPPTTLPATDTSQLLALMVADQVLADAGGLSGVDRDRVGVILGASSLELLSHMQGRTQRPVWLKALREQGVPEAEAQSVCDAVQDHYTPWQEATFPGLLGNVVAGRIANRFDLHGTNHTTDAACASSFAALSTAVAELSLGRADLVVSGGVDTLNDIGMFMCFSKTPALSPTGDCRPFSDRADGTMLGEAVVMYALKRLADAERAGDRIHAVIRGIGSSSDGKGTAIYAPLPEGQARALRRAYEQAGYDPGTVELVEAHGTGTKAGDAAELAALRTVFEEGGRRARQWCAIGSVKSQIGHTKCAAGAAGLLKTVLALRHQVLPPTIKVERPASALRTRDSPFYVNTEARPWVRPPGHPRRASVSSFGFGGSNFHVTLEEYVPSAGNGRPAWRSRCAPTELVLFSAPSPDALLERTIDRGRPLAEIARESQAGFRPGDEARLAVVATDTDDLYDRFAQAAAAIRRRPHDAFSLPGGTHYGTGDPAVGKVAFLFPGQGAQYVGMGADLAMFAPEAQAVWDRLAGRRFDGRALHGVVFPPPGFDDAEREERAALLNATEWAQPALAVHSLALLEVVRGLGLRPDCVGGHSFGELVALHAAGALDAASLVALARRRGELMRAAADTPGAMLAVAASRDLVTAVLAGTGSKNVWPANHNAPDQVVVSGERGAIDAVEREFLSRGVAVRRLDASHAFHSPLVASAAEPLSAFLNDLPLTAPVIDVYGNADAAPYPGDAGEVRRRIAAHLASPVLFDEQIEAMYAAGARTFVEVGAGAALTGLVGRVLGDREHAAVALDRRGQDGVTTLHGALGRLAARGAQLDYGFLWAPYGPSATAAKEREPRMTVQISGANYGQPYPPEGGAAELPPPNPPRTPPVAAPATMPAPAPPPLPLDGPVPAQEPEPVPGAVPVPGVGPVSGPDPASVRESASVPERVPATRSLPEPIDPALPADPHWPAMVESVQRHAAEAHAACHRMLTDSHMAFLRMTETTLAALLGAPPREDAPALPAASVAPDLAAASPAGLPPAPAPVHHGPETLPGAMPRPPAPPPTVPAPPPPAAPAPTAASVVPPARRPEPSPAPSRAEAPSAADPARFEELLLSVVAERTGYPVSMLNADMALDADLGVDSIKRVEILSAVRQRVGDLPTGDVAALGRLSTLREIVDALKAAVAPAAAPSAAAAPPDVEPDTAVASREPEPVELRRLALRTVHAPAPGLEMAGLRDGPVSVVGGPSALAALVAGKLTGRGVRAETATRVPEGAGAVVHLGGLLDTGSPEEAGQILRDAFRTARSVAPRMEATGGVFVTVQDTGGDFGLDGREPGRAWLGGLAALTRTAAQEWPDASVKAIDCERGGRDAETVAEAIVEELLEGGPAPEAGLRADGTRLVPCAVEAPAEPGPETTGIGPRSVIVATGGARGVTAAALTDLARTHRPRIALLGRTELVAEPPGASEATDEAALVRLLGEQRTDGTGPAEIRARARAVLAAREVRATLSRLEEAGSPVRYLTVDVRDGEALASALREVREAWGPVTGIVHGAGVLADKRISDKTDEQFDRVMTTKTDGLRALLAATADDPVETICLFSSVAGVFGNAGQCDYAMANAVLDHVASAERARRPDCRVRSIAWGPWHGGMVTPALAERFHRSGVELIPLERGAAAFTTELDAAARDGRIVVVAGGGEAPSYGAGDPPAAHVRVTSATHPYLADHRVADDPVLPLAVVLDWFTGAAGAWRPTCGGPVLRDVRVLDKVTLPGLENEGHRFTVHGRRRAVGPPTGLEAELRDADGAPHFHAVLDFGAAPPEEATWAGPREGDDTERPVSYDGRTLFHGPRFQALRTLRGVGSDGAEATVVGVVGLGWGGTHWQTDPAAVDGALQLALVWADHALGSACLPMAVAECRVHRRGPAADSLRCVVRARKVHDTGARCDVALLDPDGTPRVELLGVELVRRPD